MVNEYLSALSEDMGKALGSIQRNLTTVRTGSASPQILENLSVDVSAYGAAMPLKQLATINAPDPKLLVVSPWDKSTIGDIEKAIITSGLGFNPANDGQIIRVPIPPLSDQRRREMVRIVRRYGEEGKIGIRGVRREYNDIFREMKDDKDISEDELTRVLKRVQEATNTHVQQIEQIVSAKEREILAV